MFENILKVADQYDEGLAQVKNRREQWLEKYEMVRDHLKNMAAYLNQHAKYKQGFFVDTLFAYNEDIMGTNSRLPSITFRTGSMPMLVTFRNSMGEKKAYTEEGFSVSFTPSITGQIVAFLQPHYSSLDKEPPEIATLALINKPGELTPAVVEEIITKGMEVAFQSSFTAMGSTPEEEENNEKKIAKRNPIGFRKHDTTEKVI